MISQLQNTKYFIYHLSLGKYNIPYLPIELRILIWDKIFPKPYIVCNLYNQIQIVLEFDYSSEKL